MRGKLSYANVVGTLALVLAIVGGTAVALPGKNSVQSNDLKKNSVKARAIANSAVRAAEIKDGSIADEEVVPESLGYGKLGSNSVAARIRTTQPMATGDATEANPLTVPTSGGSWPQAANEMQLYFGEVKYSLAGTCTGGGLNVRLRLSAVDPIFDGVFTEFFNPGPGPVTLTEPFLYQRPWLFEPGADRQVNASLLIWDDCSGAGQSVTLDEARVNVVGMR